MGFGLAFLALGAEGGALGEIGEPLKGEELSGGVVAAFGEVAGGLENGVVGFGDFGGVGGGAEEDFSVGE